MKKIEKSMKYMEILIDKYIFLYWDLWILDISVIYLDILNLSYISHFLSNYKNQVVENTQNTSKNPTSYNQQKFLQALQNTSVSLLLRNFNCEGVKLE